MGLTDTARRVSARVRAWVAWGRQLVYRVLDLVPPLRRMVDELIRVEFIDRSMVVAAQALLALIPMIVVVAAFLPDQVTQSGVDRFEDVTGLSHASGELVASQVQPLITSDDVRAQTGLIGLLIVVLSASSFARAVMRAYERIWALPTVGGIRGRRLSLLWLLGWLLALQAVTFLVWLLPAAAPLWLLWLLKVGVVAAVWWWTMHTLLSGRVAWRALICPAVLSGVTLTAFTAGSALVMPRYAVESTEQFGTFGLVLAVATWLVATAGVAIVTAVVGRTLVEDPWLRRQLASVRAALRPAAPPQPPEGA